MGVWENLQNCTKSSLEVQYLAQSTWIVVLITFRAIFLAICPKITDFRIFSYSFLYKRAPNQKGDALDMSPKLPDPENLGKAFSHSVRSSIKGASDTYLFDIKSTVPVISPKLYAWPVCLLCMDSLCWTPVFISVYAVFCGLWQCFRGCGAVPGENKPDDQLYEVFSKLGHPPPPSHF